MNVMLFWRDEENKSKIYFYIDGSEVVELIQSPYIPQGTPIKKKIKKLKSVKKFQVAKRLKAFLKVAESNGKFQVKKYFIE